MCGAPACPCPAPSRRWSDAAALDALEQLSGYAAAQGWPGNWRLTEAAQPASDPLEKLEEDKEQVRALAERYGLLSREIVNREARWGDLFKALRIMELAGELLAGHFFEGLSGPQFISPRALSRLQSHAPPESFWLNATDPASPCGLSLGWAGMACPPAKAPTSPAWIEP